MRTPLPDPSQCTSLKSLLTSISLLIFSKSTSKILPIFSKQTSTTQTSESRLPPLRQPHLSSPPWRTKTISKTLPPLSSQCWTPSSSLSNKTSRSVVKPSSPWSSFPSTTPFSLKTTAPESSPFAQTLWRTKTSSKKPETSLLNSSALLLKCTQLYSEELKKSRLGSTQPFSKWWQR